MNILITGGTEGLGKALVKVFLRAGHDVDTCSRKHDYDFVSEMSAYRKFPETQRIAWHRCDVSRADDVENFVDHVTHGRHIDVVINNAGIYGPRGATENLSAAEWRRAIEINLFGPLYVCQHIVPHFKKQKHGRIINVSGGGATKPMPGRSAYAASKAALVRFTETLALELRPYDIEVNAVAPGVLPTRMHGNDVSDDLEHYKRATDLCLHLANGVPYRGRLISAVWDDYKNPLFKTRLFSQPDACTLRRNA